MNATILRVEHLMMHFGGIKALNDVNLEVQRGSITALIGLTAQEKRPSLTA